MVKTDVYKHPFGIRGPIAQRERSAAVSRTGFKHRLQAQASSTGFKHRLQAQASSIGFKHRLRVGEEAKVQAAKSSHIFLF
jgi:hypothetical protein